MTDQRVKRCLDRGMSLLVGTVDADGTPSCCRAVGLASNDDLSTVTVYLPLGTSQRIIQDVATTHRIAVAATHVIDHCSIQLKGKASTARLARPEEAPLIAQWLDGFSNILDQVGLPRGVTRTMSHWPAFAIEMRVEQVFEQTPGPNAGSQLK
jgi:hypothetical protein